MPPSRVMEATSDVEDGHPLPAFKRAFPPAGGTDGNILKPVLSFLTKLRDRRR